MESLIGYYEADKIKSALLGRKIVKAENNVLTLDTGTELFVYPNKGGCSCSAGDYYLDNINKFDNIITNVEVKVIDLDEYEEDKFYQLFVYSGGISTSVADISGSDGNGYYGTGFSLLVKEITPVKIDNRRPVEEY
jgi:hypothetical protein